MYNVGHFRNGLHEARTRARDFERDTLARLAESGRDIEPAFRSLAETADCPGVLATLRPNAEMRLRALHHGGHVVGPVLTLAWRDRTHHFGMLVHARDGERYSVIAYGSDDQAAGAEISVGHETVEAYFSALTEAIARVQFAFTEIDRETKRTARPPGRADGWFLACFAILVIAVDATLSGPILARIQSFTDGHWLIAVAGLAAVWTAALGGLKGLKEAWLSGGHYRFGLLRVALSTGLLALPAMAASLPAH